jgi:hypothetical protein
VYRAVVRVPGRRALHRPVFVLRTGIQWECLRQALGLGACGRGASPLAVSPTGGKPQRRPGRHRGSQPDALLADHDEYRHRTRPTTRLGATRRHPRGFLGPATCPIAHRQVQCLCQGLSAGPDESFGHIHNDEEKNEDATPQRVTRDLTGNR